jgi:hypothetical protein
MLVSFNNTLNPVAIAQINATPTNSLAPATKRLIKSFSPAHEIAPTSKDPTKNNKVNIPIDHVPNASLSCPTRYGMCCFNHKLKFSKPCSPVILSHGIEPKIKKANVKQKTAKIPLRERSILGMLDALK